jgi:hypothetical protein
MVSAVKSGMRICAGYVARIGGDDLGCLDVLDMWLGLGRLSRMLRCAGYVARIGETI